MKCPNCTTDDDRVIDSRPAKEGRAIRRRRECLKCGHRFTTYEAIEDRVIQVIKTDQSREPFDREKVYRGLSIACTKRPIPAQKIDEMTDSIEARVLGTVEREVTSQQIGQWILDELSRVDEVAYVRFASVFKRYGSVTEFMTELQRIASEHP
jgi:transcriptional repressor NrdR